MRVYILSGVWEYDCSQILGVYEDRKTALEQKKKQKELKYNTYDDYVIDTFEVLRR